MSQTNLRNAVINGHDSESPSAPVQRGLTFKRFFTKAGQHPFDEIDWELRTASINLIERMLACLREEALEGQASLDGRARGF